MLLRTTLRSSISHAARRGLSVRTYYLDPAGSDSNDGLSPSRPWATLAKLQSTTLQKPCTVAFKGGATFSGALTLTGANHGGADETTRVIYTSYGGGRAKLASATNGDCPLTTINTAFITVEDLDFEGTGSTVSTTTGLDLQVNTAGNVKYDGVVLRNLNVSKFGMNGIVFGGLGTGTSGFTNFLVENCIVHNCGGNATTDNGNGIVAYGNYGMLTKVATNTNVTIRNCLVYDVTGKAGLTKHTGSGILLGQCSNSVVEFCEVYNCGQNSTNATGGPVGIWMFDCDGCTIRFCESHHNRTGTGTPDGGGFDIDGGCINCTLEYNYSHDNQGSGFQIYQYNDPTFVKAMNNVVIRYNISENDGTQDPTTKGGILIGNGDSRNQTNIRIYNNTIISSVATGPSLRFTADANNNKVSGIFANNILYAKTNARLISAPNVPAAGFEMTGNIYYTAADASTTPFIWSGTTTYATVSAWRTAASKENRGGGDTSIIDDPQFVGPLGLGTTNGFKPNLMTGYQTKPTSPARNAGRSWAAILGLDVGTRDLFGNTIPAGAAHDIGAFDGSDTVSPAVLINFRTRQYSLPTISGTELVTNGGFASDISGWVNASSGTGTATSASGRAVLTGTSGNVGRLQQSLTTVAGVTYQLVFETFEAWGDPATGTSLTVGTTAGGSDILGNQTISTIGLNTLSFTASSTTTWINFFTLAGTPIQIDNVSVKELVIATPRVATEDEIFSRFTCTSTGSARTYVGSDGLIKSNILADKPRFDWTGGVQRLLLEDAATNLLTYSEDTNNAVYTRSDLTTTLNDTAAPDGTLTANRYTETNGAAVSYRNPVTISAGTTYTASVFAKRSGTTWFRVILGNNTTASNGVEIWVNLLTGVKGTAQTRGTGWTLISSDMTAFANGWYRISLTFTPSDTTFAMLFATATADLNSTRAVSSFYPWGLQLEVGRRASSYIRTTDSTVTRAAERFRLNSSIEAMFQRPAASAVVRRAAHNIDSAVYLWSPGDILLRSAGTPSNGWASQGSATLFTGTSTGVSLANHGVGLAFDATGRSIASGTVTTTTDTGTVPSDRSQIYLGSQASGGTYGAGLYDDLTVWSYRMPSSVLTAKSTAYYEPETAVLLARMASPPSATRASAINRLFYELKAAGLYSKLDSLQIYAAHDQQAALLDWVNPTRVATATATFTVDRGFTTGANAVVNLGFGPTTAGLQMTLNSQTFGFFSDTTETTNSGSVAGAWDGTNGTTMLIRNTDGSGGFRSNQNTVNSVGISNFTPNGLWTVSRSSSTSIRLVQNGGERWNANTTPSAAATTNFFVGGLNASGGATKRFNLAYAGLTLSNTEISVFNLIVRTYLTTVGVV